jgi:hypothetical protein
VARRVLHSAADNQTIAAVISATLGSVAAGLHAALFFLTAARMSSRFLVYQIISSASRSGSAGNGAAGSAWYQ